MLAIQKHLQHLYHYQIFRKSQHPVKKKQTNTLINYMVVSQYAWYANKYDQVWTKTKRLCVCGASIYETLIKASFHPLFPSYLIILTNTDGNKKLNSLYKYLLYKLSTKSFYTVYICNHTSIGLCSYVHQLIPTHNFVYLSSYKFFSPVKTLLKFFIPKL